MRGERAAFRPALRWRDSGILLGMLAALTVGSAVGAQGGPIADPALGVTVSVEQGLLVEQNPLRRAPLEIGSGTGDSDTAWISTLGGRVGGQWGRQRMTAYGR